MATLDLACSDVHGEADRLRAHSTYPLPIAVITELFGVPDEMRADLRHIVDEVFRIAATSEETATPAQARAQFLAELVGHKRQSPGGRPHQRVARGP